MDSALTLLETVSKAVASVWRFGESEQLVIQPQDGRSRSGPGELVFHNLARRVPHLRKSIDLTERTADGRGEGGRVGGRYQPSVHSGANLVGQSPCRGCDNGAPVRHRFERHQ